MSIVTESWRLGCGQDPRAPPDRDIDLVAWLLEFCRTLEIITRTLCEVVNRERLCGTSALVSVASARWVAVRPLEEVLTQSIFVWVVE